MMPPGEGQRARRRGGAWQVGSRKDASSLPLVEGRKRWRNRGSGGTRLASPRPPQKNPPTSVFKMHRQKDLFERIPHGGRKRDGIFRSSPIRADPATIGRLTSPETDDLGETGCKGPGFRGRQHAFVGGFP
ncbi:hypothetical protein HPP92_021657 [Vanilla planifolia]|uniref:Uncharacterized protein n=1 Tax=Vanilla planifolia TaxID=51239 RepID=A0A835PVY7_VANPL|nr:hypothetical protein HPP92_021657 [Vanilla planifolia]